MANQPRQTRENKQINWSSGLRPKVGDVVNHLSTDWVNVTGMNGEPGVTNDWERLFPQNTAQGDIDAQLNNTSTNAVENKAIANEFNRTNLKPQVLSNDISSLSSMINLNYTLNVISSAVTINLYQNTVSDFNFQAVCLTGGTITIQAATGETINISAPNGSTVSAGQWLYAAYNSSTNTFIVYVFVLTLDNIQNITEIPNRSYDDLQNLPTLGALSSKDKVGTIEITDKSVTNQKMADMPAKTLKGRKLSTSGVASDLTFSEVLSMLGLSLQEAIQLPTPETGAVTIKLNNIFGTVFTSATTLEIFEIDAGDAVINGYHTVYYDGAVHPNVTNAVWQTGKSAYDDAGDFDSTKNYEIQFWYDGIQFNWLITERQ